MVARRAQQDDGLPPGWTVQLKEMRSGRTIRYLVNSQTGQTFSSEEDFIRYVKKKSTLGSQNEDPQTDKRRTERHSENIDIKETDEEWLPDDWEVETKIRNSGSSSGTKYKCYIEPSTGHKFYSKPEVFRYLKGLKHKSCLSNQKKAGTVGHSASKASCAAKRQKLQHPTSRLLASTDKQSSDRSSLAVPETEASDKRLRRRGSVGTQFPVAPSSEIVSEKPSVKKQNDRYDLKGNISLGSEMENSVSRNNSGKSNKNKWVNLPCRSSKRLAGLHSEPPKVDFSETNQQKSTPTEDRSVSNFGSDLLGKNSIECGMEKSSGRRNNSGKHNKKGGLDLPRRSSKRLAVLKTVLPKVELSETNQQKSDFSGDKAVFDSAVDLIGKNSPESGMQKSNNRTKINSGKSRKKKWLDLPRRSSKRLSGLKAALPKVELSETNQLEIPLNDNKSVLNYAPELIRKSSLEYGMEKSSSKRSSNNSRKSNKKSELDVCRRSSERLAGFKAGMSGNTSSSEKVLQNEVMESENEAVLAMDFTPDTLADEESGLFDARPISEFARHAFSVESIPSIGELLDKSQKYLDDQVVPADKFLKLDTEKSNYEKSDLLFGDPCLEFAFKTLTGAMPHEDALASIPISTCAADILQEENLSGRKMEKSCDKKCWTDVGGSKEKKELNMPCWLSKQTAGLEHELVGSSALQISARKSCETKPNLDLNLALDNLPNGASHKLNSGSEMGLVYRDSSYPNAPLHEEPSKNEQILKDRNVSEEEIGSIGSVKVNGEKPVSQTVFPSGDYWSDPCLEFAFKTLTGAISLEDNFAVQDYPQPQLDTFHRQRDGNLALPDFSLPSHFQSDISSHFDTSERGPGTRQQLPLNPSVPPPPGNKSLPSCSAVDAQQPFTEQNKDIQGKLSS
ncbi:uncharacterized protein LOC120016879 isoform X2 [Tripterygium wilfordii]|uniref:uncharacterized protein LOC120016879 isoform X2 n=1 Tax=Tripterygium wilfordii TaxID=458696 RepID=UPI0018F80C9C|nr:uncharacterized protein LOC120016879 isoform X2 [Tripterygium wilfordii]